MQKNKISKRLLALKEYASKINHPLSCIADIGTDHGYLTYACYQSGLISKSILCDINQGPLDNAIQTFKASPYENTVSFRLGSGLEPLEVGEVDLVFIAGMGGGLIRDLLANAPHKSHSYSYYILQPMTEQSELRKWLLENNFNFLWDGYIFESGKHYEVLVIATQGVHSDYSSQLIEIPSLDLEFGIRILSAEKQAYSKFLTMKQNKYETILSHLSNHNSESETHSKFQLCHTKLETIFSIREKLTLV